MSDEKKEIIKKYLQTCSQLGEYILNVELTQVKIADSKFEAKQLLDRIKILEESEVTNAERK